MKFGWLRFLLKQAQSFLPKSRILTLVFSNISNIFFVWIRRKYASKYIKQICKNILKKPDKSNTPWPGSALKLDIYKLLTWLPPSRHAVGK